MMRIDESIYPLTKRTLQRYMIYILLITAILLLCLIMLMVGNQHYSFVTVINVLSGEQIQGPSFAVMIIRLPRMLAAVLTGLALGMAGCTFQTMLRNPLASPDIIGISSGSSAAAIFCISMLGLNGNIVSIISVLSGLLIAILIYMLSGGIKFSSSKLILIGIGMQTMLNACISYVLLRTSQYDVAGAMRWLSGSLNGIQMEAIPRLLIAVLVFSTVILLLQRRLRILELGEQTAITLGIQVHKTKFVLLLCAVCLIAFSISLTGPIAFVAFLAGPIAKKIIGNHMSPLMASALIGAIFVLASDILGQFLFTTRFPVGVMTGILGTPYLLFLLIQMKNKGGEV